MCVKNSFLKAVSKIDSLYDVVKDLSKTVGSQNKKLEEQSKRLRQIETGSGSDRGARPSKKDAKRDVVKAGSSKADRNEGDKARSLKVVQESISRMDLESDLDDIILAGENDDFISDDSYAPSEK